MTYCLAVMKMWMKNVAVKIKEKELILHELKVDKSKVFVILNKFDGVTDPEKMKNDITNDLKISNPIAISSKTGYGIHKLKTIIGNHTHIVKLTN